jgi:glyoxylase-like metal-dependent hydrolase (beta-lactamase superfamily II)
VVEADRHAWERPGAHEEAPGIFRIPLPLPGDHLQAVNVYAIADGDRLVLIDGGWALADSLELLTSSLTSIGFELGAIREFLVTHIHRDHYTQAVAVRRQVGSSVSLGEGERLSLEAIRTIREHPDVKGLHRAGAFELSAQLNQWTKEQGAGPDLTDWEDPDRWLPDGLDIPLATRTLRVIATPGHTRGHVVFHDPEHSILFGGDHVLPHITPSIGIELVRTPSPLRDYLSSLRLTRALPDARLLPAHGPVVDSVHARVEELLHHHEQRLDATADKIAHGASTGFEVANALTWTRREKRLDDLDLMNQIMAINETVAHLEVLVERGVLTKADVDTPTGPVTHYTTA